MNISFDPLFSVHMSSRLFAFSNFSWVCPSVSVCPRTTDDSPLKKNLSLSFCLKQIFSSYFSRALLMTALLKKIWVFRFVWNKYFLHIFLENFWWQAFFKKNYGVCECSYAPLIKPDGSNIWCAQLSLCYTVNVLHVYLIWQNLRYICYLVWIYWYLELLQIMLLYSKISSHLVMQFI